MQRSGAAAASNGALRAPPPRPTLGAPAPPRPSQDGQGQPPQLPEQEGAPACNKKRACPLACPLAAYACAAALCCRFLPPSPRSPLPPTPPPPDLQGWHPGSYKNTEKVWQKEQEAAAEQRKLEELRKQMEDERRANEYVEIAASAGHKR